MAEQSFLAELGLRSGVVGSASSLAICAPVSNTAGSWNPSAHTAANRTGIYFDQTAGAEVLGIIVGAQAGMTLNRSGSLVNVSVSVNTDNTFTTGYGKLGFVPSGTSTTFYIAQASNYNSTDWGFAQTAAGATFLNIKSGQSGGILVGNANKFQINTSSATFASGVPVTISSSTNSSSYTTGALIVSGGIGVSGNGYFNGNIVAAGNVSTVSGVYTAILADAGTTTIPALLTMQHSSSGTPGVGFGSSIVFNAHDDGNTNRNQAQIAAQWTVAATATRTARLRFLTVNSAGALAEGMRIDGAAIVCASGFPVTISDTTASTTTAGALLIGTGTAATSVTFGGGSGNIGNNLSVAGTLTASGANGIAIAQTAAAGGSRPTLACSPATNLSMLSGTESSSYLFNSAVRTWATSTPATQREMVIAAPTYACDTAAQTITTAATVAIVNAPSAGTNVTITAAYALWVQGGASLFAGAVTMSAALTVAGTTTLSGQVVYGNTAGSLSTVLSTPTIYGTSAAGAGIFAQAGHLILSPRLSGAIRDVYVITNTTTAAPTLTVSGLNSVIIGSGAIATTATDGFLYMPTCAGPPTGVPTAVTGRVAFVYDSTNNQIYLYNGAWKKTIALT